MVYACTDAKQTCDGGNVTGEYCRAGQRGPLCSLCDHGRYHAGTGKTICSVCGHGSMLPVLLILFVLLSFLAFVAKSGAKGGTAKHTTRDVRLFRKVRHFAPCHVPSRGVVPRTRVRL